VYIGPPYFAAEMNTVRRQKAVIVSSLMTRNSLLIPKIERPAPAESIAALETRLLPGRESSIDWAFFLGSSAGTLEACLLDVTDEEAQGKARGIASD
jgi:hypothetical protein